MSKYKNILLKTFSVFESDAWKANNIKTFPANVLTSNAGTEFIRVSVVPSGASLNVASASGVLIIDIFTPSGIGPKRALEIADLLDSFILAKVFHVSVGNSLQFKTSSLGPSSADSANPSLCMTSYTIPFNFFGVL
jgi:hypothetical protein